MCSEITPEGECRIASTRILLATDNELSIDGDITVLPGVVIRGNAPLAKLVLNATGNIVVHLGASLEAADIELIAGGDIHIDGRVTSTGFGPSTFSDDSVGKGPNGNAYGFEGGGGGSYGGFGAVPSCALPSYYPPLETGQLHGSIFDPVDFGSAGGDVGGSSPGASGGGRVTLRAAGDVIVDGDVEADGAGKSCNEFDYYISRLGGSGSGGSVRVSRSTNN